MTRHSVVIAAAMFAAGCTGDEDTGTGDTDVGDTDDTDTVVDTDTDDTDMPLPEDDCPDDAGTPVLLSGTITDDMVFGPRCPWILQGGVTIGDDVNETLLTILPGTIIYGEGATSGFLAIARSSKIFAEGTAAEPIIFTSDSATGPGRGQWGGLILNGRAPINAGLEAEGEGGTGKYGGTNAADNSGILRYVRIEYGGTEISTDNEVNGLTLGGVGNATEIDYVQIHANLDDGIEFFGGNVNVKHLVVSCPGDDAIDWDTGYTGLIQFAVVTQGCDLLGNNGIEADNGEADHDATPRSSPTLSNLTFVGNLTGADSPNGILLRRGTDATIANAIVTDFASACLAIRDDATYAADPQIDHTIFDCANDFETGDTDSEEDVFNAGTGNSMADPQLTNTSLAGNDPNFAPASGSPAASGGDVPAGSFFEAATYLGAFDPAGADWTDGWTNFDL